MVLPRNPTPSLTPRDAVSAGPRLDPKRRSSIETRVKAGRSGSCESQPRSACARSQGANICVGRRLAAACCGVPFEVGSRVTWNVVPTDGRDLWVDELLGAERGDAVRFHEEHHDQAEDSITGTVVSINVVTSQRVEARVAGGQAWVPVRGGGRVSTTDVADPWGPEKNLGQNRRVELRRLDRGTRRSLRLARCARVRIRFWARRLATARSPTNGSGATA